MMSSSSNCKSSSRLIECSSELRRGPWTLEEDNLLIQYVSSHGEGRWNSLAKFAGLKRTGKSCRLRWLNYLKPDIKRGNLSPHEQVLILELHSKWGNRWSKIAHHLPGRTDNEIKNYWRTRVQKQARHLKVDSNSTKFLQAIRTFWIPRLMDQNSPSNSNAAPSISSPPPCPNPHSHSHSHNVVDAAVKNQAVDEESTYNVNVGFPSCYDDMQMQGQGISDSIPDQYCHVPDFDWFGDTDHFWNTDDLWQFRN